MGPETQSNSVKVAWIIIIIAVLVATYFYFVQGGRGLMSGQSTDQFAQADGGYSFPPLSKEEMAALEFPKLGATSEVVLAHAGSVRKAAKANAEVVIGSQCRVSPAVVSISRGQEVKFRNVDSVSHVIAFDDSNSLLIPPNETASISSDFGEVEHVYGYGCETGSKVIGVVLITP